MGGSVQSPDVLMRSLRSGVPSGYVIGRVSPGTGKAELISMVSLANGIKVTGIVSSTSITWPTANDVMVSNGTGPTGVALGDAQLLVGQTSAAPAAKSVSGDATLADTGALTLATVNSDVGSYTLASVTVDAKGRVTAASSGSGTMTNPQVLARVSIGF